MIKAFFKSFCHFFKIPTCEKCGSLFLDRGSWNRAWNALCEQASGAYGVRCYDCGNIEWDIPDEDEWLATQPNWIISYKEKQRKERV